MRGWSRRWEERTRDLREALEQQTATSDILRVISQSQRDVQPVFETIAANARELCSANTAVVYTFDGELIHLAAVDSVSPEGIKALHRTFPMPPSRGGAAARAVLTRAIVYIPDVQQDVEYRLQNLTQVSGSSQRTFGPYASRRQPDRGDRRHRYRTRDVHRTADRSAEDIRRSSGDRHREHAAVHRAADAHRGVGSIGRGAQGAGRGRQRGQLNTGCRYRLDDDSYSRESARRDTGGADLRLRRSHRRATPPGDVRLRQGDRRCRAA